MDNTVKRVIMETMDEQLRREFGFDIKTMMLFADAIHNVKTENEKRLESKIERAKHCINEINDQFERGKCSNDYVEEILKEYYENE